MIRKARPGDLSAIEAAYDEHFQYEEQHEAYTVFRKGVYPTKSDAEKAILSDEMYIYEENDVLAGSMIANRLQPVEYAGIPWKDGLAENEVMVIHLLMVRPGMSGKGIATALLKYAADLARTQGCRFLRLDTGAQNIPAVSLYKKNGFNIIAAAPKKVGGVIAHEDHLYLEKAL